MRYEICTGVVVGLWLRVEVGAEQRELKRVVNYGILGQLGFPSYISGAFQLVQLLSGHVTNLTLG